MEKYGTFILVKDPDYFQSVAAFLETRGGTIEHRSSPHAMIAITDLGTRRELESYGRIIEIYKSRLDLDKVREHREEVVALAGQWNEMLNKQSVGILMKKETGKKPSWGDLGFREFNE